MFLSHLSCLNYRNIADCDLQFSRKINCFLGNNGMGKTNLLDAIYYLSFTKSHLCAIDSQLILHDTEYFMLRADYERSGNDMQVSAAVKRRSKKQFRRDGKDYQRMSDHIGLIPAVLISPTDQELISEGSDERRRFLDTVIAQYDKLYLHALLRYNEALKSRNQLIKQEEMPDATMLDIYEEQMAIEAKYIYQCRKKFVDEFVPHFQRYYRAISGGDESVELCYRSHSEQGDLAPLLAECRLRDHAIGYSTRGAHKDDLEMLLDGYPIKRTGSQGQNKSYLVAMKLAQFYCLRKITGVTPILLLDDIFDRLDAQRVMRIMQLVASDEFGQIFITDTNRNHTEQLVQRIKTDSSIFILSEGVVSLDSLDISMAAESVREY